MKIKKKQRSYKIINKVLHKFEDYPRNHIAHRKVYPLQSHHLQLFEELGMFESPSLVETVANTHRCHHIFHPPEILINEILLALESDIKNISMMNSESLRRAKIILITIHNAHHLINTPNLKSLIKHISPRCSKYELSFMKRLKRHVFLYQLLKKE